jgi:type IV secretory pathway VirB2 component (pilin)
VAILLQNELDDRDERRSRMHRWPVSLIAFLSSSLCRASTVWALTGTGLPWDQPFTVFTEGLLGSPAHAGVALAILLTGLMWANTHHQPGIVKGTATVAGGAVAIKALDIMNVFGWGGALF